MTIGDDVKVFRTRGNRWVAVHNGSTEESEKLVYLFFLHFLARYYTRQGASTRMKRIVGNVLTAV